MNRFALGILALASLGSFSFAAEHKEAPKPLPPVAAGVGKMVPDLKTDGFQLSKASQGKKFTVVAITSTSCPLSKKYLPTLTKLQADYAEKGVAFVFVNPIASDMPEAKFAGTYLLDKDGTLAAALGAKSTTDVFLLDSQRTVIYRGAVDDQYGLGYSTEAPKKTYLKDALDAALAGKEIPVAATTAPGCELDLSAAKTSKIDVTYHNRISRIIQMNCVECHRTGGVGPFSLETMEDITSHKGMIKKVIEKGAMPPWFAAVPAGKPSPFVNDRSMPADDKSDLLAWLANGAPAGDKADAPLARTFPKEWAIGKPDLIVQLPKPVAIKASGTMPYEVVTVETTLEEDKWVTAAEVQPTDKAVVHHVLVFVLPPLKKGEIDIPRRGEAQGYFTAYVPGNSYQILPEGMGRKMPKGARVRFQIHYTPNGTATKDQTRVGFRFAEKAPANEVRVLPLANPKFEIPPGDSDYHEKAQIRIPIDAVILAYSPHMHVRGKACTFEMETVDGKKTTLLDVPHYDFNWQLQYKLAEPVKVPRGTTLRFTAWYDNSDKNPANPNPKATVRWGPQTYDEMLLGYIEYYLPAK